MDITVFWAVIPCTFVDGIATLQSNFQKKGVVRHSDTLVLLHQTTGRHIAERKIFNFFDTRKSLT
jgi:hypothetical protein